MATLIASKPMRYGTRALKAGDSFEASRNDAAILLLTRRATAAPAAAVQEPEKPKRKRKAVELREIAPNAEQEVAPEVPADPIDEASED